MDRLRVGSFITGGRFVPKLDLNDGSKYALVRDTLTFTPPERKQQFSTAGRRFGGSTMSSEITDNGEVDAEWYINGGSADASVTLLEALLQQVETITSGRFIEWKPDGASRPSYYEIAGPSSWEPMYRWIEFQGTKTLHVKAGWKVSPLAQGAPMEILEDFTERGTPLYTNLVTNPSFETGTAPWSTSAVSVLLNAGATISSSASAAYGSSSMQIVTPASPSLCGALFSLGTLAAGTYTLSAAVKGSVGGEAVQIVGGQANGTATLGPITNLTTAYQTLTITFTTDGTAACYVGVRSNSVSPAYTLFIDGVLVVAGSSAPSYFDGDTAGASWTGIRGGSTSSLYVSGSNTLADFTSDLGTTNYTIANGQLRPLNTNEMRLAHTGRGYTYSDVQVTMRYTTGASPSTGSHGVFARHLDVNDFLQVDVSSNTLRILKKDLGAYTTFMSPAIAALAANTTYWIRMRTEGNTVYAEHWTTQPTPMGAPAASTSYTLTGADVAKFGASVEGAAGIRTTAQPTDTAYDDLTIEPFVYRNQTLPNTIQLGGAIPGTAPAQADVTITPSGGAAPPIFALLGWTGRAGNTGVAAQPFGLFEAELATGLVGFTVSSDVNFRSGSGLKWSFVSSGSAEAIFNVDPSIINADDFAYGGDVAIELWGRMLVDINAGTFKVISSARPSFGAGLAQERYTVEYGAVGKTITLPITSNAYRFARLGTLVLTQDALRPNTWQVRVQFSASGAGTAVLGLDYLMMVPARRRASSPTGKISSDGTYPSFVRSTSEFSKLIRTDLSGVISQPPNNGYPDAGLGGQLIELPPGYVDIAAKLSSMAPDDPTSQSVSEQLAHSASIKVSPTPRWFFARGG